jgi:hypothetical protein
VEPAFFAVGDRQGTIYAMSATVLHLSCHKFSAADLAYLDRLSGRMIRTGAWACVRRLAGFLGKEGRMDMLEIILPGDDIASFAIERHSDGSYCLSDLNGSQVILYGRTVQSVTRGL